MLSNKQKYYESESIETQNYFEEGQYSTGYATHGLFHIEVSFIHN